MFNIVTESVTVTTTGADGSGAGSGETKAYSGYLLAVYLNFHGSAPGTTDTTIAYKNVGGNILVVTDSATDAMIAPRITCVTNANAAVTNSYDRYPVNQPLTITLAQSNAFAAAVVATFFFLVD